MQTSGHELKYIALRYCQSDINFINTVDTAENITTVVSVAIPPTKLNTKFRTKEWTRGKKEGRNVIHLVIRVCVRLSLRCTSASIFRG